MDYRMMDEKKLGTLVKFAMPTIIMMIFMSLYTIVDGIFISRFVGTTALSAVNIVYPISNVVIGIGVMLATGGSAIVAKKMGEGKDKEARSNFAFITLVGVIVGILLGVLANLMLEPICALLGAGEATMEYAKDYIGILMAFAPASILQMLFQSFFVTAGKPIMGLALTIGAGAVNAVLDYILIVPGGMGIAGAALATAAGYLIPAVVGLIYFGFGKNFLRFERPAFSMKVLGESCSNGSSEMVSNLSTAVTTFLFNIIMLKLLGEKGVAAVTIVLYAQFLLVALFLGFSLGVAPIISYSYGKQDFVALKKILKNCMIFVMAASGVVLIAALLGARFIVGVFAGADSGVYEIALHGFFLFSVSYIATGLNIFASGMFTALSNGKVSACISFLRTFVFLCGGLIILSKLFGVNGLWLAVPAAEFITAGVSIWFIRKLKYRTT